MRLSCNERVDDLYALQPFGLKQNQGFAGFSRGGREKGEARPKRSGGRTGNSPRVVDASRPRWAA